MSRKLKVGDWYNHGGFKFTFEVISIIEGEEIFSGLWFGGYKTRFVSNCYVSKIVNSELDLNIGLLVTTSFSREGELVLIDKPIVEVPAVDSKWNTTCKSCGKPAYQGLLSIECSGGCK